MGLPATRGASVRLPLYITCQDPVTTMFGSLVGDAVGLVHLVFSVSAVVTGTMVLVAKKGTARHKLVGRVYGVSMLGVIVTAFMIYRLFGGIGVFHITALISFATLLAGMLPVLFFRSNAKWVARHSGFMYWSVMGLYGAFVAEVMVRIPDSPFFGMVGFAVGAVMLVGGIAFGYYKDSWAGIST